MRNFYKCVVFSFFLLCVFFGIKLSVYGTNNCFCNANSSCYADGCTRKTIKNDNTIDYGLCVSGGCSEPYSACYKAADVEHTNIGPYYCVSQPPCCADMVARNDPEACCWPERGFCHPTSCAKVTRPEKCGWYWTFHDGMTNREQGYGCVKGLNANSLIPNFGIPLGVPGGNITVVPTRAPLSPTARPTQVSPQVPTAPFAATETPVPTFAAATIIPTTIFFPTTENTDANKTATPQDVFIRKKAQQMKNNMKIAIIKSEGIFSLPVYVFNAVARADSALELLVNKISQQAVSFFTHQ